MRTRILDRQGCHVRSCGQGKLWSDWVDAHAELSLCWAHISGGTFSHCGWHYVESEIQWNSAVMNTRNKDHSTITTNFCQSNMFSKVSDKVAYANSVDQDQTAPAPSGAVWSEFTLFATPLRILRNNCIQTKVWPKIVWHKVFEILGPLLYYSILGPPDY